MTDPIFRSDEATAGGLAAVQKVQGRLVSIKRVPSRFEESAFGGVPKDQVEITLEDAVILEMPEGEPEPELPEGNYIFWMGYAAPGKEKPHKNTFYVKGFLASGEELGIFPEWQDKLVTLEKKEIVLFKRKNQEGESEEITQTNFVFVGGEDAGSAPDLDEYVASLIVGKNKSSALRALLLDNRTKHQTMYRDAIKDDTIADMLGLVVDDKGIYQKGE